MRSRVRPHFPEILSSRAAAASGVRPHAPPQSPDQPPKVGGADRDRTGDPLLAKQVLSQLSYSPFRFRSATPRPTRLVTGKAKRREVCCQQTSDASTPPGANLVGLGRVELPTSPLSGVRSNQLSYRPRLLHPEGHGSSNLCGRSRKAPVIFL
jgi:hypothetical protein